MVQLLGHALGDIAEAAARILAETGTAALNPLLEGLAAKESGRRRSAAFGLGLLCGSDAAFDVHMIPLPLSHDELRRGILALQDTLSDQDEHVRSTAAEGLGRLVAVARRLEDKGNDNAEALAEASRSAFHKIVQRLSDPSHRVRALAATALGTIGRPEASGVLLDMLSRHGETARLSAALALMRVARAGGNSSLAAAQPHLIPVEHGGDVSSVLAAIAHPEPQVRLTTAIAIQRYVARAIQQESSGDLRFPVGGWFSLSKDDVRVYISDRVSEVIDALTRLVMVEKDTEVRDVVLKTLETIRAAIRAKREHGTQTIYYSRRHMPVSELDHESDAEIAMRETVVQATHAGEAPRFTDLILYRGWLFSGDVSPAEQRLHDNEALRAGQKYTLEVAIRRDPIGIAAAGVKRPVQAPPDRTDPGVLVVMSCRQANAPHFKDQLLAITWPRDADSTAALFRFETGDAPSPEPFCLEIRLYARTGLQLLDLLELRFAEGRWAKHQPEIGRIAVPSAGPDEDAVSFHVAAKPGGYDFEVIFIRDGEAHLDAPLGRLVSDADLETLLRRVRSFWTRLVIGKLSARPRLSEKGYAQELGRIVDLGGAAWRTLFGDRRGAQAGAPEALGETLRRNPLSFGTPVRVTLASDADAFVFPWAILCPPLRRDEVPDSEVIWGLRYRIELTRKYCEPYRRPAAAGKVRIATVLDPRFANVDHAATLDRVAMMGAGAELISGPGTAQAVLDELEAHPPAEIYYYFCHGFAPGRTAVLTSDLLLELRQAVEHLNAADLQPWQALLDGLSRGSEVAAMFTGAARITEDDLRRADFFTTGRPIVFLNMCHSADLLPSLRSGLTRVFIDRNAAAVLGTECPVTSVFADMFAERVLGGLLHGATIGAALLEARRHFHTQQNPLGLLYTLYGHEDARVTKTTEANQGRAA
jgi:hypothetical protein